MGCYILEGEKHIGEKKKTRKNWGMQRLLFQIYGLGNSEEKVTIEQGF